MEHLSDDANLLLNQIRGHLEGTKYNAFRYIEGIHSIAFGNLIGPSNTIPPANIASGQEMQKLRQKIALALNVLERKGIVLLHEQGEGERIYNMKPNIPD